VDSGNEYKELMNPPLLQENATYNNDDPAILALQTAMERALTVDTQMRPKARDVGDFLANEVSKIEREGFERGANETRIAKVAPSLPTSSHIMLHQ